MTKPLVRSIGHYDFEDGGKVQVLVTGDVSTDDALDMARTLIALKQKELEDTAADTKEG